MNAAEIEERPQPPVRIADLSLADKMNLIGLAGSPYYDSLKRLMEFAIITARDEAMSVSPAERDKRIAYMDVAYAIDKFCQFIRRRIESAAEEHQGELLTAANKKAIEDHEFIERMVLAQV